MNKAAMHADLRRLYAARIEKMDSPRERQALQWLLDGLEESLIWIEWALTTEPKTHRGGHDARIR